MSFLLFFARFPNALHKTLKGLFSYISMRIVYVTAYMYPLEGGMENNCFFLARVLASRSHEVHIFSSDRKDGRLVALKEELVDGVHIHRYRVWRYKYYLYFSPRMLWDLARFRADIFHGHGFGFLLHDLALFYKRFFTRTKVVNTPHGPFMAKSSYTFFELFFKRLGTLLEWPLNRLYHAVIAVNPSQASWMHTSGVRSSCIFYLPNGLPRDRLLPVTSAPFICRYHLQKKIIFSVVGRIQEYKGIDQFIRVLPRLLVQYPSLVFLVMGRDGGDLARLQSLSSSLHLEQHVLFFEGISEEEKWQALAASDVFVFSSEWEAFGIGLLEAMAQRTAVISTKTEGGLFLVKEGVNGFLYDFGDLDALYHASVRLLSDRRLVTRMQNASHQIASSFIWEDIALDLEKLYSSLLQK